MVINSYSDIYKKDTSLRPYQEKAKKEIFESWDEVDNVMFQMPTGTGKTRLFTSIIRDINNYSLKQKEPVKILIIAHRTELIDQIDKSLDKYCVSHYVIAGGKKNNYKKPVNVASIQTLTNKKNLENAKRLNVQFVIIDEAHHALAKTYKKLWDLYPGSKKLGVTATPWRMNHQSFTDLFDKLVLSMPIKDFIKQGYLSAYKYYSLRSDTDILRTIDDIELDRFGEYKESSMEERMDIGSIRAQLLESYQSLAHGKKGIIYAINIVHAKHIANEYEKAGYSVACIDSKTTTASLRNEIVNEFRKKDSKIDIIVNVDIFSEGFDCPDIEFIQLARPTRSLAKYLQQVGRGLRITENKQECVILDNVGMYSRFGLPDLHRHWKRYFLGKNVLEEMSYGVSGRIGQRQEVDMSEGTEDMVLIQESDFPEQTLETPCYEVTPNSTLLNFNDLFPLWGITPGKTTWGDAEEMGHRVEIWKKGPARTMDVNRVAFWDHKGKGVFNYIYWTHYCSDFPDSWKSKGFSWDNSYDEWLAFFEKYDYKITVIEEPHVGVFKGQDYLDAEFQALSPDGVLLFNLSFCYGEKGCYTSSPNTLDSIIVNHIGETIENYDKAHTTVKPKEKKVFDSMSIVETQNKVKYDDFFPLFGVKLGQTTWKQIEDLGGKVRKSGSQGICADYNEISLWDHEGDGKFKEMSWDYYGPDFPDSWKSKGFSWDNSYDEWLEVLRKLDFNVLVTKKPVVTKYSNYDTLSASVRALSPDDSLLFQLSFGYRESSCKTSSPQTLFSIDLKYEGPSRMYNDIKEPKNSTDSDIGDFFPLLGITLGKTTWREAEETGCKVKVWEKGPGRTMSVGQIDFWDHDGVGVFTSIHWIRHERDFPNTWKAKGFSWDNSYDEWIAVFERLNFKNTVILKPQVLIYRGRETLEAKLHALSPDGTLSFNLDFDYGEHGYLKSSPNTLYSIGISIEKHK